MGRGTKLLMGAVALASVALAPAGRAAEPEALTLLAAGTLAVPFRQLDALFQQKNPGVVVHPQFGGSVKMAKEITELDEPADLIAVADYDVIPKYLFGKDGAQGHATWFAGFARNAITFVYTPQSKFADEIGPSNWYQVLARPGVEIGRSDPDTDPSGYQTVQMLSLAEKFYGVPDLATKILANAPRANMRDTETLLISALQLGQIDYLAIYRSDALQHHFKFLDLPARIDLGDPQFASLYGQAVAHTKNGDLTGRPIVYAVTIPREAAQAASAEKFVAFLLGPEGQAVMQQNGFARLDPAYAVNRDAMPAALQAMVKPWPGA